MQLLRQSGFVCLAAIVTACASRAPDVLAIWELTNGDPPATIVAFAETDTVRPNYPPVRAAPSVPPPDAPVSNQPAEDGDRVIVTGAREGQRGSLAEYLRALSDLSCPKGVAPVSANANAISIAALPVQLQPQDPSNKKIGELAFVAAYQLTSPDKRFGGLSGLDFLDNGNLLAVSDAGAFVWIDLAPDGLTPVRARIATMHGAKGETLADAPDKIDSDAEGLAVNGGMALVSYERNHRVLAFDLGKCGAAARGASIDFGSYSLPLPDAFWEAGVDVGQNEGAEPLGVTSDWYLFTGLETKQYGLSPLSARPIEAEPDFSLRVGVDAPEFVGLDVIPAAKEDGAVRAFLLHRSFTAGVGNHISITETDFNRYADQFTWQRKMGGEMDERARHRFVETGWRTLAKLDSSMTVDNFEGIAARELPDGRVRIFIISDDNFSETQRTLLMVFDLAKPRR